MSDGGKVETRDRENDDGKSASKRAASDEFGRAVSKVAVAQICESVGFESFNHSALEALADIAVQYLCDLGKTATFYANLAGRTECNVFDVVQSLEDLGSSAGFSGASEVSHCLTGSGAVMEIVGFVESAEEIPFAQSLPHFPVIRNRRMTPSFAQMGETPVAKHVPDWLPAYPDPHTYIHSSMWNERATEPRADKIELVRQRRKAERSLLSLQQRLVSCGSAVPSASAMPSAEVGTDGRALHDGETENPFLATPLPTGEKDVSPPVMPDKLVAEANVKNRVSVFETFAPAIEAAKEGLSDFGDGEKKILPDKRPAIRLKFNMGRKMLGESLDLSLRNQVSGRTSSRIGRDDEKDDKKRRAEYILRHSMDNPQELTQL